MPAQKRMGVLSRRSHRPPGLRWFRSVPIGARSAFTLMELLVAMGVFAVSVGLIADLFLSASRSQARTNSLSRMQGDARLVLETIAAEFREGTIDSTSSTPETTLAIRDATGTPVQFRRANDGCPVVDEACMLIARPAADGTLVEAPLTGAGISVDRFQFIAVPDADPFLWDGGSFAANEQPHVTILLSVSASGGRPGERASLDAQTTITSRAYRR